MCIYGDCINGPITNPFSFSACSNDVTLSGCVRADMFLQILDTTGALSPPVKNQLFRPVRTSTTKCLFGWSVSMSARTGTLTGCGVYASHYLLCVVRLSET